MENWKLPDEILKDKFSQAKIYQISWVAFFKIHYILHKISVTFTKMLSAVYSNRSYFLLNYIFISGNL